MRTSITISKKDLDKLKDYCEAKGMTVSSFVTVKLKEALKEK